MVNKRSYKGQPPNEDWAMAQDDEIHQAVFNQVDAADTPNNRQNTPQPVKGLSQYLGRDAGTYNRSQGITGGSAETTFGSSYRVQFNLTAAAIDTLTAKISALEVFPQAVTNKATAKGRELAENIDQIVKGIYHKYNVSNLMTLAFRDAMVNRAGFIKVCVHEKDLYIERIFSDEVIVDPLDGYYNNPYKIIHRKLVPKSVLLMQYPDFTDEIESATVVMMRLGNYQINTPCLILAEGWCKNSYRKNGRHVICLETATLLDEEWDEDYLPILKVDYNPPVVGWTGQSVVDELEPIQRELDRLYIVMQAILKKVAKPRIFVDVNSQMNPEHFTSETTIIPMDLKNGNAPIIHNGSSVPPELPQQIEYLTQQGMTRVGLSTLDLNGSKPNGQMSGQALDSLRDVSSERWELLKDLYQRSHVDLCNIILKEARKINLKLAAVDDKIGLKEVSTKLLPKDGNGYILQIFPASMLSDSFDGRIREISQLIAMGVIDPEMASELMQVPDVGALQTISAAPQRYILMSIEKMIKNKEYVVPEPYNNLKFALAVAIRYYNWEQLNGADEEILKLLRQYINEVQYLLTTQGGFQNGFTGQQSNQPQQPSQSAPGAIPGSQS